MAVILLLICFLGITLLSISGDDTRLSILKSILLFSVLVLGLTEVLSLFKSLNYYSLITAWGVIDAVIIYAVYQKKSYKKLRAFLVKTKNGLKRLSFFEKFLIGFSGFILVGILVQGLIYPTNNWDSMLYHMARTIHWIKNESLAHYRTPFHQQLIFPVFSEVMLLNVNLLLGNDFLSNTVQLFYLIGTAIGISLIGKELKLSRFGQILSVFILICIPEVILLGSSTHNELVVSFFMVVSIYFLIKTRKGKAIVNFIFLGCALGMAAATKSTAYLYLTPFIFSWAVYHLYQIAFKKMPIVWLNYLLVGLVFVVINFAHFSRNYQLTSSILGTNPSLQNSYANETHSVTGLISSVTKNLSNQFGLPKIAPLAAAATEKIHELINVDINDYNISYINYSVDPLSTHENNGANTYHTILMLLTIIWLFIFYKKYNRGIVVLLIVIILSFLFFCFYLKWQPWIKLHAPFYIFHTVVLAYFIIKELKSKILIYLVIFGFVFNAVVILLFNYSRPLITVVPFTSEIKVTDDRYKKYFSRFLEFHSDYKNVVDMIEDRGYKNVGLKLKKFELEYQLFTDSYRDGVRPIHLNSFDLCDQIKVEDKLDCIVSSTNKDFFEYKGDLFYNVTKKSDGYLYLFIKR